MPEWVTEFPELSRNTMRTIKRSLDGAFGDFSMQYGESIEHFFSPVQSFLVWFERLLIATPWWVIILLVAAASYTASRSIKLATFTITSFFLIGLFGMWEDAMFTMSMILVSTLFSVVIGIPIGIFMARSNRMQKVTLPILDIMQTMPAFVYLIPIVVLLGVGRVAGLIAVIVYAIPPVIRLTNLGIRLVEKDSLEASTAYGASPMQRLFSVQIPLAVPTIMAGINQTIMMALSMVVLASMVGVKGLGQSVLQAIQNQYLAQGIFNGLAIVVLAIVFDRTTQAYAKRTQRYLGEEH